MEKLIIGVWQGKCHDGDLEANVRRAEEVIDEAAAAECDFVCLPETFLPGYGTAQIVADNAMALDDSRLLALAERAGKQDLVTLVGISEKRPNGELANTQVVLHGGKVMGAYSKTMLTGGDVKMNFCLDDELPVFEAKGLTFGIIICHDSSFPEVAATLAWKGARVIFSPHYNHIGEAKMDDHRIQVRNNHVGIAAHYGVVVARSNVVNSGVREGSYGYGDSAIFGPNGAPLAEAGLFTERLVTADIAPCLGDHLWRKRTQLRPAILEQLHEAGMRGLGGS